MRRTPPTLLALVVVALAVALTACTTAIVDPATETPELSFELTNVDAVVGPVYVGALVPFEDDVIRRKLAAPPTGSLNVLGDGVLADDGRVTGTLLAPVDLPRINEVLGFDVAWFVFSPPDACDVTTTNPNDATIAAVTGWSIWDGTTLDEFDRPAMDARLFLSSVSETIDGDLRISTRTEYVLAGSRAPWSARTNGSCENDGNPVSFDLTFDAGWTWIRTTETYVEDTVLFTWSNALDATTLTLEEVAALGPIGTVEPDIATGDLSTTSMKEPLADLFR